MVLQVVLFLLILTPKLMLLFLKIKMVCSDNNLPNAFFVSLFRVQWMTPKKISRSRKLHLVKEMLLLHTRREKRQRDFACNF